MTLHKFTCKECPTVPFYTIFLPKYDDVFCPCCGFEKTVDYAGVVNMEEVTQHANIEKSA